MTEETKPSLVEPPKISPEKRAPLYRLEEDWGFDPGPIAAYWRSELQLAIEDYERDDVPIKHSGAAATRQDYAPGGKIVIPAGFEFDGASIPEWIEDFVPKFLFKFVRHDPRLNLPALVHDWLYTNHQFKREMADDLIYYLVRHQVAEASRGEAVDIWWACIQYGDDHWRNRAKDIDLLEDLCRTHSEAGKDIELYKFPKSIITVCSPPPQNPSA